MTHVHAADTRNATAAASTYIRDCKVTDPDDLRTIDRALAYIRATGCHREGDSRVAATGFLCRGSHSRQAVWRQVDDAFRTKTGEYSRRGGNNGKRGNDFREGGTPRLAIFADGTLPYALSEERKIEIATAFARLLVDRYGCAVEIALHKKHGLIDHAHWLISTRVVDEGGVGPVIREMNGIASKATSRTADGWRRAGFSEFCRTEFARLLTDATGELYDARSFRRQGRDEMPTPWLTRPEYEASRVAASGAERTRNEERAMLDMTQPVRAPASREREMLERRMVIETVAMPVPGSPFSNPTRSRPVVALALGSGSIATQRPSVRIPPHGDMIVDLSGLDHEEISETIRKAVDADLKADAAAFIDEQRKLDQQRGTVKPILHSGQRPEEEYGRQPLPSTFTAIAKKVEKQPNPIRADVAPARSLLHPLFETMEEEEFKKQLVKVRDAKRRLAEALENAAHRDAFVDKVATFSSTRTASSIASPPAASTSGKSLLSPLSQTADSQEEVEKQGGRVEERRRKAAEALHDAAQRDASARETAGPSIARVAETAPTVASRPPTGPVRAPVNVPADPQHRSPHRPTPPADRIHKPGLSDPLALRRAAITAAALTRKMSGDLAAVAGMTHEAFILEVAALIHVFEQAADRTATRRMLIERVRLSGDPRLLGVIARPSTHGPKDHLAKVGDQAPRRQRSVAGEESCVCTGSAADISSKVLESEDKKRRGLENARRRDPPACR